MIRGALLLSLIVSGVAGAQAPEYERVLVPLYVSGIHGAFGSYWSSAMTLRNVGNETVPVFSSLCSITCECPGPGICVPLAGLPPGFSLDPAVFAGRADNFGFNPAFFIHVGRAGARDIAFSNRLFEASRGKTEFGTEIPVVREDRFLTGESWLIDVPIAHEGGARTHLRLYGLESSSGDAWVRVRIFPADATAPAFDEIVQIARPNVGERIPAPGDFDAHIPGYAAFLIPA